MSWSARARAYSVARRILRPTSVNDVNGLSFILVVTYGRSGSTVLQSLLNSMPATTIRGENDGLLNHLFRAHRAVSSTVNDHGGIRTTFKKDDPWFGASIVNEAGFAASLRSALVTDVLMPPGDTTLTGFKEIRYTPADFADLDELVDCLAFADQLLPGVRFVINVRDVTATSRSGWWRETGDAVEFLTESRKWLEKLPSLLDARLGEPRSALVDYDEWTRNPKTLVDLTQWLERPLSAEVVQTVLGEKLNHMKKN